jgi:hypothetical protein
MDEKDKKARLRKILAKSNSATFAQRKSLYKMHAALGWELKGIRDMTIEEASIAIDKAKKYIRENGFPRWPHAEK